MSLMNEEDMNANIDTEALMYVESVVRRHLSTVLAQCDIPTPPAQMMNDAQRSLILKSYIEDLEESSCFDLSYLLRAAMNIREKVTDETAESIDHLLHTVADPTIGVTTDSGVTLLQMVFEALVRREEFDSDASASFPICSPAEDRTSQVTVAIKDVTMDVPFRDILSCFWTNVLETTCHVCNQSFVNEPPIRTIAKHDLMASSTSNLHLRVFNRHLSCLQESGVLFIPVSHVWDKSIRRANETQAHDDDAAITLVSALKALLQGAGNAYGPGVEFWHDYYSVPQWQPETKESLLICLPAIYHQAEEILVHMADIPPALVSFFVRGNSFATGPMVESFQSLPFLRTFCEAQAMQRMWVTLEYSQSQKACLMDGSNNILRSVDRDGPFVRDTFTNLAGSAVLQLARTIPHAQNFAGTISLSGRLLSGISNRKIGERQLCFGAAMELVAKKQCQIYRDRFLAIHVLLNGIVSIHQPPPIPRQVEEAYRWILRDALSKGDYSVLLLQPRQRTPYSNPRPNFPSWLHGYQSLEAIEWAVGHQRSAPKRLPTILREAVKAQLDFMGNIEEIHYLEVQESGTVDGVEKMIGVLSAIARREGTSLSPQLLYNGLSRVFPSGTTYRSLAWKSERRVFSFEESQEKDDKFATKLHRQLDVFHSSNETLRNQRRHAAAEICRILEIEKNTGSELDGDYSRLTYSYKLAQHRAERGAERGEPICEIRCPECRTVTLLRLDLRDTARIGDRVYRIPGLGYSQSVDNGVGLVMNNGRITGRMLYDPPACDCQLVETVDIR